VIYFTSDAHLGHANVIRLCNRPFSSIEEMDETIISNWNRVVHANDTVYILGDLMFRNQRPAGEYLERLKGRKHLITGNHDEKWLKQIDPAEYFESVSALTSIKDNKRKLVLCHYPLMTWGGANKGAVLIYGHIHANKTGAFWPLLKSMENALNAGMDVNRFRPVSFDELVANNRLWRAE